MAPYWVPDVIRGLADAVSQFHPSLSTFFNIIHPFQVQHLPPLQIEITSFNSRTPRVMPPTRSILKLLSRFRSLSGVEMTGRPKPSARSTPGRVPVIEDHNMTTDC